MARVREKKPSADSTPTWIFPARRAFALVDVLTVFRFEAVEDVFIVFELQGFYDPHVVPVVVAMGIVVAQNPAVVGSREVGINTSEYGSSFPVCVKSTWICTRRPRLRPRG